MSTQQIIPQPTCAGQWWVNLVGRYGWEVVDVHGCARHFVFEAVGDRERIPCLEHSQWVGPLLPPNINSSQVDTKLIDTPRTINGRESYAEQAFHRDLDKMRQSHEVICIDRLRIPIGSRLVECYETPTQFVIIGDPEPDDETHNCDAMGCSTLSHVVMRINKPRFS